MLLVARLSGDSHPHSARSGGAASPSLAFFNIAGWNGFVLFGVQQLPAGPQRDPRLHDADLGDADRDGACCTSRSTARKIVGLVLGMLGMAVLLGDDIRAHPARRRSARC